MNVKKATKISEIKSVIKKNKLIAQRLNKALEKKM